MTVDSRRPVVAVRAFGLPFVAAVLVAAAGTVCGAPTRTPKPKSVPKSNATAVPVTDAKILSPLVGKCYDGTLEVLEVCNPSQRPPFLHEICTSETSGIARYLICASLLGGTPEPCAYFRDHQVAHMRCLSSLVRVHAIQASLRGGAKDLQAACREASGLAGGDVCSSFGLLSDALKTGQGSEALFEKISVQFPDQARFYGGLQFVDGLPERCGAETDCREEAALVAGLRSSDTKACAKSPYCSALTNRTRGVCNSFLAAGSRSICGLVNDEVKKASEWESSAQKRRDAQLAEEEKHAKAKVIPAGFKAGQPMESIPASVQKRMRMIERGDKPGASASPTKKEEAPVNVPQGGAP